MNASRRLIFVVTAIFLIVLTVGSVSMAQNPGTVTFSNLAEGDTVSTLTTLTGTINFDDFLKYEIFLKSGDSIVWVANSHSPVIDGNLARLDPRMVQSGTYQLLVREVHSDSNYLDFIGPTVTIDNPNDVPLPYYPEIEPSFLYPSETLAVIRAANCTSEDFHFDYTSPQDFKSAGEYLLPGKTETSICTFVDFAVIPGEYRGTAKGGGQTQGVPLEFLTKPGKVYQINYYGPGAGGDQVVFGQATADDPQAASATVTEPAPAPAVATDTPAAPTAEPTAAPAPVATEAPILPVSGNANSSGPVTAFTWGAVLLIIFLVGTGIFAAQKKRDKI